jgi:hypothetical protein
MKVRPLRERIEHGIAAKNFDIPRSSGYQSAEHQLLQAHFNKMISKLATEAHFEGQTMICPVWLASIVYRAIIGP